MRPAVILLAALVLCLTPAAVRTAESDGKHKIKLSRMLAILEDDGANLFVQRRVGLRPFEVVPFALDARRCVVLHCAFA